MNQHINKYYKPLFFFVQKRVRNRADAEDLTQDVLYKLVSSDNDKLQNVKSWMYTIAQNTVIDYYRRKKVPMEDIELLEKEFPDADTDSQAWQEMSACIVPFIAQLPEEYRTLMQLSELDGIPQKELAEKLDMNYTTLRSKVQRGRKKLKQLITSCCTVVQGGRGHIIGYERSGSCDTPC